MLEYPFHMKQPTYPREQKIKQFRFDINVIAAVQEFAARTRRSETVAWEILVARGLIAMGAVQEPLEDARPTESGE